METGFEIIINSNPCGNLPLPKGNPRQSFVALLLARTDGFIPTHRATNSGTAIKPCRCFGERTGQKVYPVF